MIITPDHPSTGRCPELLSDLHRLADTWDESLLVSKLISQVNQLISDHDRGYFLHSNDTEVRRMRMSAVRYQKGSIEESGNWYYVRFRVKVPGRKKPKKERKRICPVKGPGSLSEHRRQIKAQEIVDASGVNDAYLNGQTKSVCAAVTLRERGDAWLREVAKRKRKPVASRTLEAWGTSLHNWIYPELGDLPLSNVNNAAVKPLVSKMSKTLKPNTIKNHLAVIKLVVASAVNDEGEQLYPRKWNHEFMDVPLVVDREVNAPCFSSEIMSGLARWKNLKARTIFILCAASSLRIGETLGLDLSKHFSEDFRTLRIEQKALYGQIQERLKTDSSYREIDLDPRVAAIIKEFADGRSSGLLFRTRTGKPLRPEAILRWHLHPALKEMDFVNPITGNHYAGTHAFRRFRETHLGKVEGLPRGIRLYWMGHAEENMTDHYDKIKEDRATRREWAERCGIGFELPSRGQVVPIDGTANAGKKVA